MTASEMTAAGTAPGHPACAAAGPADSVTGVFQAMVADHYDRALTAVLFEGASPEDARDAVQQAYMEAWEQLLKRGPSAIESPRAWFITVAVRKHRRPPGSRRKVLTVLMPELPELDPGDFDPTAVSALSSALVRAYTEGLDERQRMIMLLRAEGLTISEINRELGGADTLEDLDRVGKELRKARKLLRKELGHIVEGAER